MDCLLKLSENYQKVDDFDEKVFLNFMKQVTIWDYFGISKEDYFALPESQKRIKISQYYLQMQSKGAGECLFVYLLMCCLERLITLYCLHKLGINVQFKLVFVF